ncbi:hypothetical protein GOBAR_AA36759 [Gossypium barbadense]|uniref:Uncharacterized protein n=1 Tax=Gossypium barbadense TaxID=3634 RepID=A0A2P5VYQ2_GOSBA|nr:hypothetical protein GOBAR_AA36759 [Gossypium barbadense]
MAEPTSRSERLPCDAYKLGQLQLLPNLLITSPPKSLYFLVLNINVVLAIISHHANALHCPGVPRIFTAMIEFAQLCSAASRALSMFKSLELYTELATGLFVSFRRLGLSKTFRFGRLRHTSLSHERYA